MVSRWCQWDVSRMVSPVGSLTDGESLVSVGRLTGGESSGKSHRW